MCEWECACVLHCPIKKKVFLYRLLCDLIFTVRDFHMLTDLVVWFTAACFGASLSLSQHLQPKMSPIKQSPSALSYAFQILVKIILFLLIRDFFIFLFLLLLLLLPLAFLLTKIIFWFLIEGIFFSSLAFCFSFCLFIIQNYSPFLLIKCFFCFLFQPFLFSAFYFCFLFQDYSFFQSNRLPFFFSLSLLSTSAFSFTKIIFSSF